MATYTPRFVTQFDGSSHASVNCTPAAGAMLLDRQTGGRIQTSGADLRARQSDQSGGMSLDGLAAAWKTYGQALARVTLPTVLALRGAVGSGQGAILQGYYGSLPAAYRRQASANIDHALYIDRVVQNGNAGWWYWVMDPIGKAPYQGAWVPESAIRAFGWTTGGQGWVGSAALSSPVAAAKSDQPAATGSTSIQRQLLAWVQETMRDPNKTLTEVDLRAFLAWYARKQSPAATDAEIAAFVREGWSLVSGWVGKAPAFLSSKANDPVWSNVDPLAGILAGAGKVAQDAVMLAGVLVVILLGLYLLAKS